MQANKIKIYSGRGEKATYVGEVSLSEVHRHMFDATHVAYYGAWYAVRQLVESFIGPKKVGRVDVLLGNRVLKTVRFGGGDLGYNFGTIRKFVEDAAGRD